MLWFRNIDIKINARNLYDLINKEIKARFETRKPTDK